MGPTELQVGDVVQITPDKPGFFRGCFMIVTEAAPWGAQGFIAMPLSRDLLPGRAYFRCPWVDMELVGRASWVPAHEESE